jgi:hypothetical protein
MSAKEAFNVVQRWLLSGLTDGPLTAPPLSLQSPWEDLTPSFDRRRQDIASAQSSCKALTLLPIELASQILSCECLDAASLVRSQVCKGWKKLCENDEIWRGDDSSAHTDDIVGQ